MTAAWEWFGGIPPVGQALLATIGTWLMTALGAAVVVVRTDISRRYLDASVGFAAGVMIAASFWSLLAPAIEMAEASYGVLRWVPALVGFVLGALTMRAADRILPHMHADLRTVEGVKTSWHRSTLLVLAITMHNIPEGLAVGAAFGAATHSGGSVGAALALALGIALQNFPEGTAVALPLRREGVGRGRALWYGQLSGVVEPFAGVLGAWLVIGASAVLPYALAFAAGAMIFVVAEELIPESQRGGHVHHATSGVILGFAVMMTLDVALS
ncbi:MAG: ZIP family metal transporter [Acidobacteria bacterium]|nr:ZIP family metal transporter [Acidobacteriota bacterium]